MDDKITNYYEELEIRALTYILFLLNTEIDKRGQMARHRF
jgi:hypothetical protein